MKTEDALTITFPPGTRIDTEFTCPECGGYTFGSTGHTSSNEFTGYCHGEVRVGVGVRACGFTWDRNDDFKVFRVVAFAENGEAYRALWDQVHNADRGVRGKV